MVNGQKPKNENKGQDQTDRDEKKCVEGYFPETPRIENTTVSKIMRNLLLPLRITVPFIWKIRKNIIKNVSIF